jgi:plastocyanin
MLRIAYRRSIKNLLVVSAVGLSALFTLIAVFDVPPAQADHHEHVQPAAAIDTSLAQADHHEHTQLATAIDSSPAQVDQHQPASPTAASAIIDVSIVDFAFDPSIITITAGSTVRWTRSPASTITHTTTSDIGSLDPWDSGQLAPGASFTKTFNTPGTYTYRCEFHPLSMHGTVVVLSSAPQPPTGVSIDGPDLSEVNTLHVFTATVNPITATQPITFVWEATGQSPVTHTGSNLIDVVSFTWATGTTGTARITATATNAGGTASGAFTTILIPQPSAVISDVRIVDFAFQSAVITVTAGTTVRWTNIGAVTHTVTSDTSLWDSGDLVTGGVFSRTFTTPGTYDYHCAYHAASMKGKVVVLAAGPEPPAAVSITGPIEGVIDTAYAFTATVSPITAAQPITYFWQATGQSSITHTGSTVNDTIVFTWTSGTTGTQLITATAANAGGTAAGMHLIIFNAHRVYLPLVLDSLGP